VWERKVRATKSRRVANGNQGNPRESGTENKPPMDGNITGKGEKEW